MASLPKRRIAWILLLGVLAQPGWAVVHALIHDHLAHHHGEPAAAAHEAAASVLVSDERPHDHGHLGDALLLASRVADAQQLSALPSASPATVTAADRPGWVVRAGPAPRASPGLRDPSNPRAPPHA